MKKLLFVSWDGPQVNYLEGLFLPIFAGLKNEYTIHIIQFSWGSKEKILQLQGTCEKAGVIFKHFKVTRKPHPLAGMAFSLAVGAKYLKQYIELHGIDILMPRSNFPALMSLYALKGKPNVKFIFDADGLPLEEKVDFDGLITKSVQYKLLKLMESKTIEKADAIITRTDRAIDFLTQHRLALREKFYKVINGRDINFFDQVNCRSQVRNELGLDEDSLLLIYAGSLGPQYGVAEMLKLYSFISKIKKNTFLLILSNQQEFLNKPDFKYLLNDDHVFIKDIPFQNVPAYLSAADVALAIREPFFSMIGVAPIKIGEYLLSYLPVIASAGVGDTEAILRDQICCFVLQNHDDESLKKAAEWAIGVFKNDSLREEARALGVKEFSLERSIESYRVALNQLN